MSSYNPYDILKNDNVRRHIKMSIKSFSLDKFVSIDRETLESMVSGSVFWECVGGTGIVDTVGDYIGKKTITDSLRKYQSEQITVTKHNPSRIEDEIKFSLIFSTLLWAQYARYVGVGDSYKWMYKLPFKMLKNLSFKKGLEEYASVVFDNKNKIMWSALANPVCLLMNELYYNQNTDYSDRIDMICKEILSIGIKTDDIKDLLDTPFDMLLNSKSIRQIVLNDYDSIKKYVQEMNDKITTLNMVFKNAEHTKNKLGDKEFEDYL